jgi:DNA polymerase-1
MRSLLQVREIEKSLLNVCADIETRGIIINREYARNALIYEQAKAKEARENFETITGRTFVNSSKLFAEIYAQAGEAFPLTEKGNPSFKADFLEELDTPISKLINTVRHHEKRSVTYFNNFLYYSQHDGLLHPSMNQAGTVTGRFSYSNPNLQNVPKEDEEDSVSNVRRTFVPPIGYSLLSIDYSQQEYRIMLDYAKETKLIDEINAGADLHQATADLLGCSRKAAKTLNFLILYGGGVAKLAKALNIEEHIAKEIRKEYFYKLPGVKGLIYEATKQAERRGFIFNRFGRRGYFADRNYCYKAPNFLCQSTGADVIKNAMVQLHEFLIPHETKIALQVHDELVFYLKDGEEFLIPEIKKIMESIYIPLNGLPLTVSEKQSKLSWSHWDME